MPPIFYITLIFILIIIIIPLFVTKNKWEYLFYVLSLLLVLTPSTKLLGLDSSSSLNYNVNQFIIYFLIFLFFVTSHQIFNKKYKILTYYYKSYGIYFAMIIIAFVINMIFNSMYYRKSIFELPRYHFMEYLSFFVIMHFFLLLFSKIQKEKVKVIFRNFWVILLTFSSIFSLLYTLKLPFAIFLQGEAYNFNFKSEGAFFDNAIEAYEYLNRSYSIFAGGNQFGILAPMGLLVTAYFLKEKLLSKLSFTLLLIPQLIILVTSLSRTAFLFYLFAILILIVRNSKYILGTILLIFGGAIILIYAITILDERLKTIFDFDFIIDALFSERIDHWMKFIDLINLNPESIVLGHTKSYLSSGNMFFENGYLNLYAEGGILTLLMHLIAYFVLMYTLSKQKNRIINPSFMKLSVDYLFLFLLIEVLQGAFVSFRFESINAITIGYFIYMKYLSELRVNAQKNNANYHQG